MLLDAGHKFDWSAAISPRERPDIYKPAAGVSDADMADFSFEHPEAKTAAADANGRELRGIGDNVVQHKQNTVGIARYIRSPDQVLKYLTEGVPADTIAVIDDSGGTLTAPILEHFKGVICAGGSTRSHLGILTREYGVPCVMNAKISGIRHGDTVEIESTAVAKTAEAYQKGIEMTANVWRLKRA
jgi:phosphohistidine swiveling domain-containing protein